MIMSLPQYITMEITETTYEGGGFWFSSLTGGSEGLI